MTIRIEQSSGQVLGIGSANYRLNQVEGQALVALIAKHRINRFVIQALVRINSDLLNQELVFNGFDMRVKSDVQQFAYQKGDDASQGQVRYDVHGDFSNGFNEGLS